MLPLTLRPDFSIGLSDINDVDTSNSDDMSEKNSK